MAFFTFNNRWIRSSRLGLSLAFALVFGLHLLGFVPLPLLERLDYIFYDLRLQASLSGRQDSQILILDIDEKSLAQEGRWPWSREKISYLVDMLFDYYGARLLAFDVVFSESDQSIDIELAETLVKRIIMENTPREEAIANLRGELANDERLGAAFKDRSVILGYFFSGEEERSPGVLPPKAMDEKELPFAKWLLKAHSYGGNLEVLQQSALGAGFINTPYPDKDGVLRRVPLLIRYQDRVYDALSLAVLRALLPGSTFEFQMADYASTKDARLETINLAGGSIPVDQSSAVLIPFKRRTQGFRYVSATDVLNAKLEPDELRGKVLLMGSSAAGLSDFYPTPVRATTPGVEIHANIISSFFDKTYKAKPSWLQGWELLQLLLLMLVVSLVFPRFKVLGMVLGALALFLVIILSNLWLWQYQGLSLGLASPLVLLSLLLGVQMVFGYFFETRRERKLGQLFGQYIPPQLVEEMSRSDTAFGIGGESRELTVLFSDIRGFTTLSEKLDPEQLCNIINEIFTELTLEIQATKGTIDKYMGDAVMAFWGAPMPDERHAAHAVAAGLAMIQAIERLNERFAARGMAQIKIGVGINTGVMNVGNMGSDFRMAYTVMGDAVNLGSRLEGLTKSYGTYIIVSESTRAQVPDYLYLELDRVRVKGKLEPISIYQPLCLLTEASDELHWQVDQAAAALAAYRAEDWKRARGILTTLAEAGSFGFFAELYLKRIEHYEENPPEPNWDSVFVHETK